MFKTKAIKAGIPCFPSPKPSLPQYHHHLSPASQISKPANQNPLERNTRTMSATAVYSIVHTQGAPSPTSYTYPTPFTSPLPLSSKVDRVNIRVATGRHAISSASTGNIDAYTGPPGGEPSSRSPFLSRSRTRQSCVGGAFVPLPPQVPSRTGTAIHPLLHQCPGNVDLRQPWERVQADWASTLDDVATNPLLPSLAITNPFIQWPIVVQRSGDRAYVTVGDVLRTMWAFFEIPLAHESTPEALFGEKRMRMGSEIANSERNHQQVAACRVDLMMGQTWFVEQSKGRSGCVGTSGNVGMLS